MNTIGRRAVDVKESVGGAAHAERTVERQRIARAAAVAFGCHHGDLGDRADRLGEDGQSRREVTIVVAQQNVH